MSKICAIGGKKVVLGVWMRKIASAESCDGCGAFDNMKCRIPGGSGIAIEDGGSECKTDQGFTHWAPTETTIAAAWARQALANIPALPAIEPGDAMDRAKRTREDVVNLLAVLAAEMDAEGGAA